MGKVLMELDEDLVFKDLDFGSQEALFTYMGKELNGRGYVKEEYTAAIIEREKNYPTGFHIEDISIAIPHVDAKYANKNGVFIATLKNPIQFEDAEDDRMLDVKIIFGLIIKDHDEHVEFLTKISGLFQKEGFLESIKNSKDRDEMLKVVKREFN